MQASVHLPDPSGKLPATRARIALRRLWGCALLVLGAFGTLAAAAAPAPVPVPAMLATPLQGMATVGLPPVQNFDPSAYAGAAQNWAVTQGADGVIYVANSEDGVLSFDGSEWRRIPVRDKRVVRSVAAGPGGRIYVGTIGDFGYLKADALGQMHYVSLLAKVPAADRDFEDVWSIYPTPDGIYFATLGKLFVLCGDAISVLTPAHAFHLVFDVGDTIYAREAGRGLVRLVGDRFEPVPGGERFADIRVYGLVAYRGPGARPGELLVATRSHGWFRFDGQAWSAWPTGADGALQRAEVYGVIRLAGGRLAVATLKDGVYFLDEEGRLLGHLDHTNGLASDIVLGLYQDRERGLWLATNAGVSRVDLASPVTHFGEATGLYGAVLSIIRHAGTLYVGTDGGVFRLSTQAAGSPRFERLPGAPGQNWAFVAVDDQLLTAGNEGVYAIQPDGSTRQILKRRAGHALAAQPLLRLRAEPSRVFIGFQDGIGTVRWDGRRWIDEGRIPGVRDGAVALATDAAGELWAGPASGGVVRVVLPPGWQGPADPRAPQVTHFGSRSGVPRGVVLPDAFEGAPILLSNDGIYRFDARAQRFSADPAFAKLFADGPRSVGPLVHGRHGRLWMYSEDPALGIRETGHASLDHGRWQWHQTPLQPLRGESILSLYQDADGTIWVGAYKRLFRLDRTRRAPAVAGLTTLIRAVTARQNAALPLSADAARTPTVAWGDNDLRFRFTLASFDDPARSDYQVYLEGSDSGWSPWSPATYRDYTNLAAGRYLFHVRGRDMYGNVSREATFAFRVLPPWYRTPWAWALWIAGASLLLGVFVRWRSAALRQRHHALAILVNLRTAELAQANDALARNNALLAEQSTTDPLTRLKNRRYLYEHVAQDLAAARRQQTGGRAGASASDTSLIFLMADIDHFKAVNDRYGHGAGDRVLVQLADTLRAMTRGTDIPIRWGGEEFLLVARFAAADAGPSFAERVRAAVAAHPFDIGDGQVIHCTCSIGFAAYPLFRNAPRHLDWDTVVNLADACLYAAKSNGRNAWSGISPSDDPPAGDPLEALRAALASLPADGPFALQASWLKATTQGATA
jgi:diguanylate cyclase (GGDEF)-like protein